MVYLSEKKKAAEREYMDEMLKWSTVNNMLATLWTLGIWGENYFISWAKWRERS